MSKASDYRNRQKKTTALTLPSGAIFTVTRPPLQLWLTSGKLPQSLVKAMVKSGGMPSDLSADDTVAAMIFMRDAVVHACVEPRLVGDDVVPDDETELRVSELDPEDFQFLSEWVFDGSPGVPVATKGGEVAHGDLIKFRQKQPGRVADAGADGSSVLAEAVEPIRAVG